ncbi:hypothetical protein R6Q59_003974 [Mikania micrantha]
MQAPPVLYGRGQYFSHLELLRNVAAEKHQEKSSSSSGEECDDRFANSPDVVMFGQEINVPFYDSVAYFEQGNGFLDIEEQLPDLQQLWEC